MAGYLLSIGVKIPDRRAGGIRSITNVRDTAIIVCEHAVYRARPDSYSGVALENLVLL
jgi:hypothetical protein